MATSTKTKAPPIIRFESHSGTVGGCIEQGFSDIEELGSEFREIYDNATEGLQQTDTNQRRDSTASEIEGFSQPDCDSSILSELDCSYQYDKGKVYRGRQNQSRACRAGNAANMLRAASEAINEWLDNNGEVEVVEIEEGEPNAGKWKFVLAGNDSTNFYDTEDEAKEAVAETIGHDLGDYEEAREEAEGLAGECEELADSIDGLDWPGMFG